MPKQINVRVSDYQHAILTEESKRYGMSVTEYVKFILNKDVRDYVICFKGGTKNEQEFEAD